MDLCILNVTFDCSNAAATARFWSNATRWPASFEDTPGNPYWVVSDQDGRTPRLVFVEVSEPKTAKNRVHLDLLPEDGTQGQEVERLVSLGARIVEDRRATTPGGWVVMTDPEGNEFCVEG